MLAPMHSGPFHPDDSAQGRIKMSFTVPLMAGIVSVPRDNLSAVYHPVLHSSRQCMFDTLF
ncbi:hypothetical protein ACFLQN_00425 [Candidatus Aenigmatarchaeota archaeon]